MNGAGASAAGAAPAASWPSAAGAAASNDRQIHVRLISDPGRRFGLPSAMPGVFVRSYADEEPGRGVVERAGVEAGVLEGSPACLQQQPVLRVHWQCFPRGDAEQGGVEAGDIVEQAGTSDGSGAVVLGVWMVAVGEVESLGRDRPQGVRAG